MFPRRKELSLDHNLRLKDRLLQVRIDKLVFNSIQMRAIV
jgi:hypothetical protein